jgi:hypothetical protein
MTDFSASDDEGRWDTDRAAFLPRQNSEARKTTAIIGLKRRAPIRWPQVLNERRRQQVGGAQC